MRNAIWVVILLAVALNARRLQAQVLWSADHENSSLSQWELNAGGGEFNSGSADSVASKDYAHTGTWGCRMTINTAQESGTRLFRWRESQAYRELYYSAWFYFPQRYAVTQYWNIFQWKSKRSSTQIDPFFVLNVGNRSNGEMFVYLHNWQKRQSYSQTALNLPLGKWVHIEARYVSAGDATGRVTFWQDGTQLFDLQNVQTRYADGDCQWSIDNYSNALSPQSATIYSDDAAISTARVGGGTDGTAPTVAFTAPADGATVSGTFSVAASASDNLGVARVEFQVDGILRATDAAAPFSFSWSTTQVADGSHALRATAYDAAGNSASASVAVMVQNADTLPPSVTITAPANGATVSGSVMVSAIAADNTGVVRVAFLIDGALTLSDSAAPYSFSWNSTQVADGTHSITAKAYDLAGNVSLSSISVTVRNTVAQQYLLYDEALATGWGNNSWSATVNYADTTRAYSGVRSIKYTATAAWAGLDIRHGGFSTSGYTAVQFALWATQSGQKYAIFLKDAANVNLATPKSLASYGGDPVAGAWKLYTIPLADLNASNKTLGSFVIHEWLGKAQPALYVDAIRFVSSTGTVAAAAATDVLLSAPSATPNPARVGTAVSFSAAAALPDGTEAIYSWSFGDGSAGTGSSSMHSFTAPGTYEVQLTISDSRGEQSTHSLMLIILAEEAADSLSVTDLGQVRANRPFRISLPAPDGMDAGKARWRVGAGELPARMKLSRGRIVGGRVQPGVFIFDLTITPAKSVGATAVQQRYRLNVE